VLRVKCVAAQSNQLTGWSRIFIGELIIIQLKKNHFSIFYKTRSSIIGFTKASTIVPILSQIKLIHNVTADP
jgi:hypothetical protein